MKKPVMATTKEKTLRRATEDGWCEAHIKLTFDDGEKPYALSITGSEGTYHTADALREQAKEHWRSYFEDMPAEVTRLFDEYSDDMIRLFKEYNTGAEAAAALVLEIDGEFHGLEIVGEEGEDGYRVLQSCGMIHETLSRVFPELRPWLKWHLNDMKAGCKHQEEFGWNGQDGIALTRKDCTDVQLEILDAQHKPEKFQSAVFEKGLRAPCPICGYRYGTKWLHHALPEEVVEWFDGLNNLHRKGSLHEQQKD